MTQIDSETPIEKLIDTFLKYQAMQQRACARDDTAAYNRHYDKIYAAINALIAKGSSGRLVLESLLTHPVAYVRLRAAGEVLSWDTGKAIPVLGRLLIEDLGQESSVAERIDIRVSASGWLYELFGVKDFDGNKLIEPLRAYGIEVPRRPERIWL